MIATGYFHTIQISIKIKRELVVLSYRVWSTAHEENTGLPWANILMTNQMLDAKVMPCRVVTLSATQMKFDCCTTKAFNVANKRKKEQLNCPWEHVSSGPVFGLHSLVMMEVHYELWFNDATDPFVGNAMYCCLIMLALMSCIVWASLQSLFSDFAEHDIHLPYLSLAEPNPQSLETIITCHDSLNDRKRSNLFSMQMKAVAIIRNHTTNITFIFSTWARLQNSSRILE